MKRANACAAALTILLAALPLQAATVTWLTASGTNDWFNGANWTGGNAPTNGDDVVITNNNVGVLLTNSTFTLSSILLSNSCSLVFSNWDTSLTATNVMIMTNAFMTLPAAFTNGAMSNRVYIICTNITIGAGAAINADRCGYEGGTNPGVTAGQGPGGGYANTRASGGGHGGHGGVGNYPGQPPMARPGITNGNAAAPLNPGSGGGGSTVAGEKGGQGGGAVFIQASGSVTNNGTITANGGNYGGGSTRSGGGSGGSIYITCATVGGNGVFRANGGNGYPAGTDDSGGGGAGGRIAIVYNPAAQSNQPQPQLTFQAGAGAESPTLIYVPRAEIGTLYFPDGQFFNGVGLLASSNFLGQIILSNAAAWTFGSLTISNTWIRFPYPGFALTVLTNLTIDGTNGRLDIGSTTYRTNDERFTLFNDESNRPLLNVGGDLAINKGSLYVYASATNVGVPDYGALVSVTGDVVLTSGALIRPISHIENGGSALFRANDVTITTGAQINADVAGFKYDYGPGKGTKNIRAGGAGYGGIGGGGIYVYSWGGAPYGEANDPRHAGSGGGSWGTTAPGGRGGGLIRIEASGNMLCNGTLTANGENGMSTASGGGSGGGINIVCNTFAATGGLIQVRGLNAGYLAGGGGGGRIALQYNPVAQASLPQPSVTLSAVGGSGVDRGDVGAIYMPDTALLSSLIANITGQLWGISNWSANTLTISNCWVRFPESGFQLTITNDMTVIGSSGRVDIGANASLKATVSNNHYHLYNNSTQWPTLSVGGGLTLTNGADIYLYSATTNGPTPDYGFWAEIGGRLALASNSWIYPVAHPTNGGAVRFQIGSLSVATNAGFNANQAGYYSQYGPGQGVAAGQPRCGGGGYGGDGGRGENVGALGGATYGSSNAPVDIGSGGATYNSSTGTSASYGGRGGGLVRVVASTDMAIMGSITADGETILGTLTTPAGGAGGGIYLRCRTFDGSAGGLLSANGGSASITNYAGGGGGGRIAVWRVGAGTASTSVSGGTGFSNGFDGTVVWGAVPRAGTMFVVR